MYINIYGCDAYPSDYVVMDNVSESDTYVQRYGTMLLPVCTHPVKRPVIASVIFVSFILLCGFILISLTIAAVTSGINDRLGQLEKEELQQENVLASQPMNSLLTDRDMLLMLMLEVWKKDEEHKKQARKARRTGQKRATITRSESMIDNCLDFLISFNPTDIKSTSIYMRTMTNHYIYRYLNAFLLAFAALLELWVIQNPNISRLYVEWLQLILQILFTMDISFKVLAHYPASMKFFNDRWNTFDFALVLGTWVPIFTVGQPGHVYFGMCHLLLCVNPLAKVIVIM